MSVALRGNLRDFGIGEVFQLIGHQRKTGVLEVAGEGDRLRIAFDHGSVVVAEAVGAHEGWALGGLLVRVGLVTPERLVEVESLVDRGADLRELLEEDLGGDAVGEIADLLTQETIFRLLQRQRGSFHFTPEAVPHGRDPKDLLPAEQILMDGLRMVDEWRTFDSFACQDDTVYRRLGSFEAFRSEQTHESVARLAVAERLFLLIDGRLTMRRVVDLSRVGSFEGSRWLSIMHGAGLIAPLETPRIGERPREVPERGGWLPRALGAIPFGLLLLLVWMAWRSESPEQAPPIRSHGVAEHAAVAAEGRRLRHAIDAHQIATGAWPVRIDDLARPSGSAPRLAAPEGAPYYYSRRGGSYVLLSPSPRSEASRRTR